MVPVEVIQHYPPSDDDVQEPCHLCHNPNMLCCSASLCSILYSLTHATPSSKSAVDPQPMDLGHTKSKNPPQTCYNCNKLGHIAQNCLEPCVHRVHNADPLSPETIQAITEAIRIAVGGDPMRGEGVTGNIEPVRSKAKESQDF